MYFIMLMKTDFIMFKNKAKLITNWTVKLVETVLA